MSQPHGGVPPPAKPLHDYPEASVSSTVHAHYGIDTSHFNALSWIDGDTVCLAAGKFVLFVNMRTGVVGSQVGPADGGVGVVAVHPSRQYYIVGERAPQNPSIHVYAWPSHKHSHSLVDGAQVGFSACTFDLKGTRMATVAAAPDFTLAVWDWASKSMILRSKCFGSDVSSVVFSSFDNSLLVTGGAGHIKFWSMASTFTGLKLQGTLGKFGRLEISDVTGFVVLPDGKVISGAESGCLLMWEGDLVKCSFVGAVMCEAGEDGQGTAAGVLTQQPYEYVPAHRGTINTVNLIHDGRVVVTAGDDGYMRYWDREELEVAEGVGLPPLHAPRCLLEVCVSAAVQIQSVTHCVSQHLWAVLGKDGTILTTPYPSLDDVRAGALPQSDPANLPAVRFNGGGITAASISGADHTIVTGGQDGVVRLIDYIRGVELLRCEPTRRSGADTLFANPVTVVRFFDGDSTHSTFLCGFEDGSVTLMSRSPAPGASGGSPALRLLGRWKPHRSGLFAVALERDEKRLCTISRDGTIFFFYVAADYQSLDPIGFCQTPLPEPLSAEWDDAATVDGGPIGGCLIGYASGQVLAISGPREGEVDPTVSFEFPCVYALVGIRQRKLPPPTQEDRALAEAEPEDLLEEKDNGPWPVVLLRRLPDGSVAVGMRKEELLYRYECHVRYPGALELPPLPPTGVEPPDYVEEPGRNLCFRGLVPMAALVSLQRTELIVVCEHCSILLRDLADEKAVSLAGQPHDSTVAVITAAYVSYDGTMVVTTGTDGLVVSQVRAGCTLPQHPFLPGLEEVSSTTRQLPPANSAVVVAQPAVDEAPSQDPPLSIQEQKEADDRAREAQLRAAKVAKFMAKLNVINEQYAHVLATNAELPEKARLATEELELDPTLAPRLAAEKQRRVTEARQEFVLAAAREDVRTQKLRGRFIDNLIYNRFLVHAFSRQFSVASFRTADPKGAIARLEGDIAALHASDSDSDGGDGDGEADQEDVEEDGDDPRAGPAAAAQTSEAAHESPGDKGDASGKHALHMRMNATVRQQLDKLDARRRERQGRQNVYNAILARRPDPSEDEAVMIQHRNADVLARGECVLRTDPAYREGDEFRPTATAKLRRMIALERYLVDRRTAFNEKLLAAREDREECIRHVNGLRLRIARINNELSDHSVESAPLSLQPDEVPEKHFRIDREGLDVFAVQKQLEKAREEEAKKAQRGFGADLAGAQAAGGGDDEAGEEGHLAVGDDGSTTSPGSRSQRETIRRQSRSKGARNSSRFDRGSRGSSLLTASDRDRMDAELRAKLENLKNSELEDEERAMRSERLLAERRRLLSECKKVTDSFDVQLQSLIYERAEVDADLCLADVHLMLLFREYQLLLVFRTRDKELRSQLSTVKQSREKLRREMTHLKTEVKAQESTMASLQESLKGNRHEAESFIHDAFPPDKAPYVLKVFNRYIKRRKGADDDDDNDDITSDDDDDEEEEDDIGEEICPANCSEEAWRKMLALREVRLDYTDTLTDEKARNDKSKKSLESKEKSVEVLAEKMKDAQRGIEDLENEKRKELNMLNTIVPLRCHQIRCLDEGGMCPPDLHRDDVVILADEELERLRTRIVELAHQKCSRREEIAGMAVELQSLEAGKAETQRVHAEWEAKVYEVMMLKFGQRVDLELLESCGTSRRIESKREELRLLEMRWEREVRRHEKKISALRDQLQSKLLRNTHVLQDFGDCEGERHDLEHALALATAKTVERYRGSRVATKADRSNLRELIAAQQEEIDSLNAEIMMLRRKGGHAYSAAA